MMSRIKQFKLTNIFYGFSLFIILNCQNTDIAGTSSETTNSFSGVITSDGAPSKGAIVSLIPTDYNPIVDGKFPDSMVKITDEEGRYTFNNVERVKYNIKAFQPKDSTVLLIQNFELETDSNLTLSAPEGKLTKPGIATINIQELDIQENDYLFIKGTDLLVQIRPMDIQEGFINMQLPSGSYSNIQHYQISSSYSEKELKIELTVKSEQTSVYLPFESWQKKYKIKINTAQNGANIKNDVNQFPLLVRLDNNNFNFSESSNQIDIRFSKSDQKTYLNYQIEYWSFTDKKADIWVKVDTIFGNLDSQFIYLYSGNPLAADESSSSAVFDTANGFRGVWHLGEENPGQPDGIKDATQNQSHGTGLNYNTPSNPLGIIGKAQDFEKDSNQYITINPNSEKSFDISGSITISAWIKLESFASAYSTVIAKGNQTWRIHRANVENTFRFATSNPTTSEIVATTIALGTGGWYYFVGVYDGSNKKIFLDGNLDSQGTTQGPINTDDHNVWIGSNEMYPERLWDGLMDEVRVSAAVRMILPGISGHNLSNISQPLKLNRAFITQG